MCVCVNKGDEGEFRLSTISITWVLEPVLGCSGHRKRVKSMF